MEQEVEANIVVKSAIINDGHLKYVYMIPKSTGDDKISRTGGGTVHPDLVNTFARFDVHLSALAYQPDEMDVEDGTINPCSTTGFKLKGADDDQSIIIIGTRQLPNGKTLQISTPEQKYADDLYTYEGTPDMLDVITDSIHEVEQYLQGKHAPEPIQLDMFANEDGQPMESAELN
jgi:hypothetical protein